MSRPKSPAATVNVTQAPVAFPTTILEKKPVYSMVILYENAVTGIRATHFSDNLMRELGEKMLWTTDVWNLKMLSLPDVRRAATEAAAISDVVILALDGHSELSDNFKAWMEGWGGRLFDASPVLIALFSVSDKKRRVMVPTMEFLGTFAKTCGLTFLHTLGESVVEHRSQVKSPARY